MTNYERIKNMSIRQMAHYLAVLNGGGKVREASFMRWLCEEEDKGDAE